MTTFQAIVFGIVHGISEFLPISANAHHILVPYLVGWPVPNEAFSAILSLGSLIAVFVYFIHDWASIISCFLQVLIYRKRPMTLDERLPLFLLVTTLPSVLAWYYLYDRIADTNWTPLLIAALLVVAGFGLVFFERMSRKSKGMFDWNWIDALVVGVFQTLLLVPGVGRIAAALAGGLFRNYNREAAAKYAFLASAPILAGTCIVRLHGITWRTAMPIEGVGWLSLVVAVLVAMLTSLLAIGGLMKGVQRKGFGQYALYRVIFGAVVCGISYLRTRG